MNANLDPQNSTQPEQLRIAMVAPSRITFDGVLSRRANTLQVLKMTQALTKLGHNVHLIVPEKCPYQLFPLAKQDIEKSIWENLSYHYGLQYRFPIKWIPAIPGFRSYDFSLCAVLWALRWNADFIYTRLPQAAAIASSIGLPTILETHDFPQGNFGPRIINRFLRGRGAFRWVVITQALASDLLQKHVPPSHSSFIVIAPDGVDLERYSPSLESVDARIELINQIPSADYLMQECKIPLHNCLNLNRFIVGYTGHLYEGRGTELLLKLAMCLPEVTFLIVGGEEKDVSRFQADMKLKDLENIILTGFVPNTVLSKYQAACDVLIMPYQQRVAASSGGDISRYLSPMKLFEYMACQRVVVSSNLPVLQEVLNSQNSVLLSGEEVDEWASALNELQNNPGKRRKLAAKAYEDVQRYTWEKRVEWILKVHKGPSNQKRYNQ